MTIQTQVCSYNKINGTWACENSKVQNDLLKYELGFQGPIITDWGVRKGSTVPWLPVDG
jgi:beta-glucosidase